MSPYVSDNKTTYLCAEITYSKNDEIDQLSFDKIKKIITKDLIKTKLVKQEEIISFSENKEDFVYPVQFTEYKTELAKTNSAISKFRQISTDFHLINYFLTIL